jgi:hypothetical protein
VFDGRHREVVAVGLADRATGRPLRPDAQIEIGSNTKTFVATVALQLVAEHRLSLTDPIEKWLPGVVPGGSDIYDRLPDWLVLLDLWSRGRGMLDVRDRDEKLARHGLAAPPVLFEGVLATRDVLLDVIGPSRFGSEPMEGVVLRGANRAVGPGRYGPRGSGAAPGGGAFVGGGNSPVVVRVLRTVSRNPLGTDEMGVPAHD